MKKRQVDEETNAETWTPSKKLREMNGWRDHISHQRDVHKDFDVDFKFANIHLMSHWVQQIRRYRALRQYTAERHEQAHKMNHKEDWNTSNHNLNYLPQVIPYQRRILFFEIRELNVQALAQRRGYSAAAWKVILSGADLASPLGSQ